MRSFLRSERRLESREISSLVVFGFSLHFSISELGCVWSLERKESKFKFRSVIKFRSSECRRFRGICEGGGFLDLVLCNTRPTQLDGGLVQLEILWDLNLSNVRLRLLIRRLKSLDRELLVILMLLGMNVSPLSRSLYKVGERDFWLRL